MFSLVWQPSRVGHVTVQPAPRTPAQTALKGSEASELKRASIIALFVTVLFLLPMLIHVGDPPIVESSGITPMRNTSTNAEGGMLYSGTGAARTATLKGLTTNETAGPLHIDSSSSDFGSVDLPAGWTETQSTTTLMIITMRDGLAWAPTPTSCRSRMNGH